MELLEVVLARLEVQENGCWIWTGPIRGTGGYGGFYVAGHREHYAHRAAYEAMVGPIPKGLLVCHHCDVPLCCNPDHLFVGTQTDNLLDSYRKGRNVVQTHPELLPRGENHYWRVHPECTLGGDKNGSAKLTKEQVAEIRSLRAGGMSQKELVGKYGVSRATVYRVSSGRSWRNA